LERNKPFFGQAPLFADGNGTRTSTAARVYQACGLCFVAKLIFASCAARAQLQPRGGNTSEKNALVPGGIFALAMAVTASAIAQNANHAALTWQ
jgi:hypothetical protein